MRPTGTPSRSSVVAPFASGSEAVNGECRAGAVWIGTIAVCPAKRIAL